MSKAGESDELLDFVRKAKAEHVDDQALVTILREHGWSERRVYAALSRYYNERVGAIPERGGALENARDAFLYLLAFATLGVWTVALVWLADILADRAFPSPIDLSYTVTSFREQAAGQLASLIVAFPIFLAVTIAIVRETRRRPEALESGVRKWLTYLALVVTAVVLVGDGIWFLTQFLLGEVTVRFAVKAIVLFAISGGVFWYYLGTVRADQPSRSRDVMFGWAASVVVLAAIVLGFTGIGTPAYNREVDFDQHRVSDLQTLARRITAAYAEHKELPRSLSALVQNEPKVLEDPLTGNAYVYQPGKAGMYRLCATFQTDSRADPPLDHSIWKHPAGSHCFILSATQAPGP
jgi:Domain of unknown function (DUF5671)